MTANEVKEEILSWLSHVPKTDGWQPDHGTRGTIIGLMNESLRLDGKIADANIRRHRVLAYLFREVLDKPWASQISTKELTDEMWYCLARYVEPHKDDDGKWRGREGLSDALIACFQFMEDWQREMDQQLGFDLEAK